MVLSPLGSAEWWGILQGLLEESTLLQEARNGGDKDGQPREHKLKDRMVNAGRSPKRDPGTGNMLDLILRSR